MNTDTAAGYKKALCAWHTEEPILELSHNMKWPKFMFTILEVILALLYAFIADKLLLVHQRTGIF